MDASRACRASVFALGILLTSEALGQTPALVVDADTGKVLHAERATDPWFPASITKLMTAYVALKAVREGKVTLDTPLPVSAHAAAMPPSKVAFKPGMEVTLDNALKIIMVKSANDVAVTIAEGIGGSVEGFADMMNATAQRLGMRESHFVNPHGLPDERQQTSARDMAILGRAILRDLPEYRHFFQIGAIQLGKRIMKNHNGLIGRYPGADGMKTGYICASGFNVVASATRNGRRLITVVMGSPNAKDRTLRAWDLFDRGFASFGWGGQSLEELPASIITAAPDMRPVICGRRGPIPSEEETQPGSVEANASGNSDNAVASLFAAPSALSYAAGGDSAQKRTLGPRAYLPPIRVWAGRTPPTALAESEDVDQKPAPARKPSKTAAKAKPKSLSRTANTAAPAGAAHAAAGTPSIIEDGKAKGAIRPSVALSPGNPPPAVRGQKPKRGAIEPKRKPIAAAAAPAAKPAAAKPAPAKPKASVKTSSKPGPKNTTAPARAEASAKN
jgi:D-alanyl-D-alanine carboxypeptidase